MKRASVVLLVALVLALVIPIGPIAAKESGRETFSATLTVQGIGPGTVTKAGGFWLVKDRPVTGTISGELGTGTYIFTYSGLINADQSGQVRGTMSIRTTLGTAAANVAPMQIGTPELAGMVMRADGPHAVLKMTFATAKFELKGRTGRLDDVRGKGTLGGTVYPILSGPDPRNSHVIGLANGTEFVFDPFGGPPAGLVASALTMTGSLED